MGFEASLFVLLSSALADPGNGSQLESGAPLAQAPAPKEKDLSLAEARRGFKTKLIRQESEGKPAEEPPRLVFRTVHYSSPVGKLVGYLSVDPEDGKKHPAIVWVIGGFQNGVGSTVWQQAPPENDQSARAFRRAGIITMYPSFRGGNDNPGFREAFLGEEDDLLAAADFLAGQSYVDPRRIYLGGHSTGGTMVLLAAASSGRFRAVFSFGPVEEISGYGDRYLPFDLSDKRELELRSPVHWLHSIESPTFVFEGTRNANLSSLRALAKASRNPQVRFYEVKGADHFNILDPVTRLIASKVLKDDGPKTNISFTEKQLSDLLKS